MYGDLDESQLITIADLLKSDSANLSSRASNGKSDPMGFVANARKGACSSDPEDHMHNVLGIVTNSSFREVPNKHGGSPYCVLDMDILDETCKVSLDAKQTLSVRLWGAVTRDHLRHRFIEGSVVLLVSVELKPDTYHKGRLTLQQRSYHNRSVSYVLCEDHTTEAAAANRDMRYWFDGGNKGYPHIVLVPQRYPLLYARVAAMRRWANESLYGSSRLSSATLLKGGGARTFSRYAANLREAAQVSGRWILDMCVCATVYVLTSLSADKNDRSNPPPVFWQFSSEAPTRASGNAALLLRDLHGTQFRLDTTCAQVAKSVEKSVGLALESSGYADPMRVTGKQRADIKVMAPVAGLKSNNTKKRERSTSLGDASPEEEEDSQLMSEPDGLGEHCATGTLGAEIVEVHPVHLMVLLQSVLVLESAQNVATVIQANKDSRFQTWNAANNADFISRAQVGGEPSGAADRHMCLQNRTHPATQQSIHGLNGATLCSWSDLTKLVKDSLLGSPRLVTVQCALRAALFPGAQRGGSGGGGCGSGGSDRYENIRFEDLVHVSRRRSKTVSLLPQVTTIAAATGAVGADTAAVDVTYRDALFFLSPVPEEHAAGESEISRTAETGTQSSTRNAADSAVATGRRSGPTPTPTTQPPMDFYCMSALSAVSGTPGPATGTATTQQLPISLMQDNYVSSSVSLSASDIVVRTVVPDEVLMKRVFCNIPAHLAAASITRACWESSRKDASHIAGSGSGTETETFAEDEQEQAYAKLPRYNYANAVCRLSAALMHSCTTAAIAPEATPALRVEVEVLVCPARDEHGVLVMLDQHSCLLRDIRFTSMHGASSTAAQQPM